MKKKRNRKMLNWLFISLLALSGIGLVYLLFFQRRSTATVTATAKTVTATVSSTNSGTTLTVPGQVTGASATPSVGSILLNWSVPSGTAPTSYRVMRSLTGTPGSFTQIGTPTTNTYTDLTVTGGTNYVYQIIAVNAQGSGTASASVNATGAVAGPGAATGLTATASPGSTALAWTAPVSGTAPTGYKVMRRTGSAAYAQIGATVAAPATSYSDTSGVAGTAYDYQIVATNAQGDGVASNTASATAQAATGPGAATGLTATASPGSTALAWSAPASGTAPTGYKVMRRTGSAAYAQIGATVAAPATSYSDTSGVAGTAYDYQIVATNAQGDAAASNTASATAQAAAPNAPTGMTATLLGSLLSLTWNAPASGAAPTGYKLMRSTSPSSGFTEVMDTPNLFHNDTSAAGGTQYYYKVAAYNTAGTSGYSNTVSVTMP